MNKTDTYKTNILGINIDNITLEEISPLVSNMVFSKIPHTVVPINPEMIMMAQRQMEFREVLNRASLALPDGIGVVLASRILKQPIRSRITGIDTVKQIASIAQRNGWRIFLLGAAPGVAELVKGRLEKEYPGIIIVGTFSGSPALAEDDKISEMIKSTQPEILLVAYGAPKQELWVARNLHRINVPLVMCVGGTFDFIAGITRRAPNVIRSLGLEWLHRLISEPWRWRRMLALPKFAFKVLLVSLFNFRKQKNGIFNYR